MYSFLFVYELESKEKRDAFFDELKKNDIENKCAGKSGCNMYRYFFADGDDTHVYIVESWVSKEAQQVHCTQPHCAVIKALKEKYGVKSSMVSLS